ncbi:Uncharacterized protein At2g27730, mitochondrial [Linum grandiflorum]
MNVPLERINRRSENRCQSEIGNGTMATRMSALRYVSKRFSSSGKVLSEEEKAAENIYIKKMEQEKLEKLARKGPKPEEKAAPSSGGPVTEATPSASAGSTASTEKTSTDKYRNYAVVTGLVTIFASIGWFLKSGSKKEEAHE